MSSEELNVKINSANEYNLNAQGKNLLSLNISNGIISSKEIINGQLVIQTSTGKKINISNWESLSSIQTTEGTNPLQLTSPKANITNPITENNYNGTGLNDTINASAAPQITYTERYKKGKKWATRTVYTGIGANINAGDGNDDITGSIFNDTINGGGGTNTINVNTTIGFGEDTILLSQGENLEIKLTNIEDTATPVGYDFSGNDLFIRIYNPQGIQTGSFVIRNYRIENFLGGGSLKVVNNGGTELLDIKTAIDDGNYNHEYALGSNYTYTGTRFDEEIDASAAGRYTYTERYKRKGKWKTRTVTTDTGVTIHGNDGADAITGSAFNDTLFGGAGNDTITGGAGNDTITGGAGNNTIKFTQGFGNDTIRLTNTENLVLDFSDLTNVQDVNYRTSGNNLIIETAEGTVTLLDFANSQIASSVTLKRYNMADTVLDENTVNISSADGYWAAGSRFDTTINASAAGRYTYTERYKKKGKWKTRTVVTNTGVTVNGGAGDDTITGSNFNDTIYGGDGNDTISAGAGDDVIVGGNGNNIVKLSVDNWFGNDTYYLTQGENLKLQFSGGNTGSLEYSLQGNDLIISVFGTDTQSVKTLTGTLNIKNFGVEDIADAIELYTQTQDPTDENEDSADVKAQAVTSLASQVSPLNWIYAAGQNYTAAGTMFDDTINASAAGPYTYTERYKQKGKWKTRTVTTNTGVTIDGARGDDTIIGSNFNDTIYGGEGNDIINAGTGDDIIVGGKGDNVVQLSVDNWFGNDTYYLTQGENLKLQFVGNNTGSVEYKIQNNDLIISVFGTNAQSVKTLTGTLNIKNYGVEDISSTIRLYTQTQALNGVSYTDVKAQIASSEAVNIYGGSYTGTRFNDTINASDANQVITTYQYKKGKKKYTGYNYTGIGVTVDGGDGNDTITGSNFNDTLLGGDGIDTIKGGVGDDYINGDAGADSLEGGDGNDTIYGGDGNDTITGGKGSDYIHGGKGINTIVFKNDNNGIGDGTDIVYSDGGTDTLNFADVENFSDLVVASDGTNLIIKYSDNGNVILDNYLTNAENSVKYITTQAGLISFTDFINNYNSGVYNKAYHTSPREFATIGADNINGTDGNNEIIASDRTDYINAQGGNDVIHASRGNDFITGGTGTNTIVYNVQNFGTDVINLTSTENLTIDMSALNLANVNYIYGGNDLVITTEKGNVILKDFAISDVTGETGSVNLKLSADTTVDLRAKVYDVVFDRNFTGTWHNENIDASSLGERVDVIEHSTYNKKTKKTTKSYTYNPTGIGADIDGGAGNDTITGSAWADNLRGSEGSDTIHGGDRNDIIDGGTGDDFLFGDAGDDTIYGGEGNDEITGGEGNDTIRGGAGNNTIIYNTDNDGSDTIYSSGGTDTLQFNNNLESIDDLTFARWGTNLIIKYSNSGRITVNNYFLKDDNHDYDIDPTHSVQKIQIGEVITNIKNYLEDENHPERLYTTGEGLIEGSDTKNDWILGSNSDDTIIGKGGNDTIDAGLGNNTIVYRPGDGQDVIKNSGGIDTLEFTTGFENDPLIDLGEGNDNNLYIRFNENNVVTIENFKTGDYSVQYLRFDDDEEHPIDPINDFLVEKYGTNGNDVISSSEYDETFNLNRGSDTVVFGEEFGHDTVTSLCEINDGTVTNTDTLLFNYHSIAADNLDVSYNRNNIGVSNGIMIVARDIQADEESGRVEYNGFINGGTPNLIIKDNQNRIFEVKSYNNGTNADWSGDTLNHVAFIQGTTGTNYVVSNAGHNIINTSSGIGANGTESGAALNYTYKGGHDRVRTESRSNDTYNIESFTSQTALSIKDGGGEDRFDIGTNAANIRFLFNVKNEGYNGSYQSYEDEAWDQSSLFMIHRDKYNTQTIMDYIMGEEEKSYSEGIVTIKLASQDENAEFNIFDDIEHMHTADFTDDIDLSKWFEGIDARVLSWIQNHNFASTIHAFDSITNACENSKDEEGNDLVFANWLTEHNFELTDNQTQQELGNVLVNQLLDIYRDASYESVVLGGTNSDDTIVGSIGHDYIYGQGGNDTITGAEGNDYIEGGTGNNTLIYKENNFGNDTVELTATENLTLDLRQLNLEPNQVTYSYSGNDLLITTPNGTIRLNNFASSDVTNDNEGHAGSVILKLSDYVDGTVDLRAKMYDVSAERITNGTWHNENINASNVGEEVITHEHVVSHRTYNKKTKKYVTTYSTEYTYENTGRGATINGGGGDDVITGSAWDDTITVGSGNVTVDGGDRNDTIIGGTGTGTLSGGQGNDTISASTGSYTILGGAGNDILTGGSGTNILDGGADDDTITAGSGTNTIIGGYGNDTIHGGTGTNDITGGAGNDTIYVEQGINTIHVGTDDGTDTIIMGEDVGTNKIVFDDIADSDALSTALTLAYDGTNNNLVIKYSNEGIIKLSDYDYSTRPDYDYVLKAGSYVVNLYDFIQSYGTANINITGEGLINGTDGNDTIIGSESDDQIYGNGGIDKIYGEGGNDHIEGGGNGTELYGGAGNDTIITTAGYTKVDGGTGNNNIDVSIGYYNTVVLNADCGNDTITCNTLTNILFADVANQNALGNAITFTQNNGDYVITYGSNIITLKNVNEYGLNLKTADNEDQGISLSSFLEAHPMQSVISDSGYIRGTNGSDVIYGGNDYWYNDIRGFDGDDIIYGGSVDDNINAGAGNDTIYGGAGNDTIEGGRGNDIINGGTGANTIYFSSGDGDDIVQNGGGTDELYFYSNIGNNSIYRSGNDLIIEHGDGDSVTVENYYTTQNHSVKYITVNYNRYTVEQAITNWGKETGEITNQDHTSNRANSIQSVILGNNEGQTISARTSTNQIFGGAGNDSITGGSGRDDIFGGDGNDYIRGVAGEDHLWGGAGANTFEFRSGDGADIIYEYGADNTLYFPEVTSFEQLTISSSANSLLSNAHFGTSWTQQILTVSGYGTGADSIKMYNSGYENYKIKIGNGSTLSINEFIRQYHPEITSFVSQNGYQDLGSAFSGGTQYVPTNLRKDLKARSFISQASEGSTIYSGGSIAGYAAPTITGGSGNDTIYAGLDENGRNILYFKPDPYTEATPYDLTDWGYARLCYRIVRDVNGNPVVTSTNADGSQNVETVQEVKVGGYFYTYSASIEYVGVEHSDSNDDWWDTITLSQSELQNYYNQYSVQKQAGTTTNDNIYEEIIDWNPNIEGVNRYYDSFTQYKSFAGPGTYEEKVNYYCPDNINEEFKYGALTETFNTTVNGREVTMTIYKNAVGVNYYASFYAGFGYALSTSGVVVDGGDGDDTIYTNNSASGGKGNDTIHTTNSAEGGEGNDKLISENKGDDEAWEYHSFDGGAGYDMIDLRQTLSNSEYNNINASEGDDTVFLNSNNTNAKYNISVYWSRPVENQRLIETKTLGINASPEKYGHIRIGDDLVMLGKVSDGGSALIVKDYYNAAFDAVRDSININIPTTYSTARYPEYSSYFERYGVLGTYTDLRYSNHLNFDYWLNIAAADGNTMYLNSADHFDIDGKQHAGNFMIYTREGQKYTTHSAAFDSEQNEKAVNFLSNGNILYKTITGYNYNENTEEYTPEYITKTILNKTVDNVTNYYTEDWTMEYTIPAYGNINAEDVLINMDVQYGTDKNQAVSYAEYYNSKGVVYTFHKVDIRQYEIGGQTDKYTDEYYTDQVVVYEEADGRKYTLEYVDGYYAKDNQGNYLRDNDGNLIYVGSTYEKNYLETDGNGDFILNVKVGEYTHREEGTGAWLYDDITATLTIHRTTLETDGSGNLQFTANVGNEDTHTVTPTTYTIQRDAEVALRTDENGYVWYKKIAYQEADGNNHYTEVKIGKVDANGKFTEIYGDTDLFNQQAYYEAHLEEYTQKGYEKLATSYTQDDFLIGGAGSQSIYGGEGNDVIYGAGITRYDSNGNIEVDEANISGQDEHNNPIFYGDNLYGEEGNDYIVGGAGDDFIDGGEGNDYILGGDGNDTIIGGRGYKYTIPAGGYDNEITTGDTIYSEGGNDTIYSVGKYDNEGNFDAAGSRAYLGEYARGLEGGEHVYQKNKIYGGEGDDTIIANGWSDTVDGGEGDDTIDVYTKYDPMYYHEGNPLYANQNQYTIDGGAGDDEITLHCEMFAGTVSGGDGDDIIDARALTKSNIENIRWHNTPNGVNIDGGAGDDIIHGSSGNDSLTGGDGNDTVYGYAGNDAITVGSEAYYRGTSYAYGGDGDDVLYGGGASYLDGGADNDTIHFATGQTGTVFVPTTLTINGGTGNDTYIEGNGYGTPGYGYDTIIASSGNDKIIFNNVESNAFTMYRSGNDLCIKHATTYAVVGGGVPYENILILKDYYSNSTTYTDINGNEQTYRDAQGNATTAKALFDNYTIILQNGDVTRGTYKLPKFADYVTGVINIITHGEGTSGDDIIEARKSVTDIHSYGGNDNIITSENTITASGGAGDDIILGSNAEVQFVTGDNGTVTGINKIYQNYEQNPETGEWGWSYSNVKQNDNWYENGRYDYTYTAGDTTGEGDDNITLYANKNYAWGEGGNDTITISNNSVYNYVWGGEGNDTIKINPTFYDDAKAMIMDGGAGNDTIIGGSLWIDGGAGNDIIKAGNTYSYNSDNESQVIIDQYTAKGINTADALSIKQEIEDAATALRQAVSDKSSAESNYNRGINKLNNLITERATYQGYVDEYQAKIDALDPDNSYYESNYSYNNNSLEYYKEQLVIYDTYSDSNNQYFSIPYWEEYVATQQAIITAAENTIAAKQALMDSKSQELKTKGYEEFLDVYSTHYGQSTVFGGAGNDEITLGYREAYEKDQHAYEGQISGGFNVRGGAGDDTYIIPDYYWENEQTGEVSHSFGVQAKITDTEGTNTLLLQSQDLTSGSVGVIMNVELDKDENGQFITDANGNYQYHLANFRARTTDGDRAPMGDGDMGYSISVVDAAGYKQGVSDYYGGLYQAGIKFTAETLAHFDRIQASDGRYINKSQIDKAAQNVANWLGEHNYPNYQYAVGLDEQIDYTEYEQNRVALLTKDGFGSLEWLDDSELATEGVTNGTEGTYLADKLTSTSADETFNLKTGNDVVTFSGEFGNDIITSESAVDSDGNATQTDTLVFNGYSLKDGTLIVEVDPDNNSNIKITAYGEDGSVNGTVVYQGVINENYASRTIYINEADGVNKLTVEDVYKYLTAQGSSSDITRNISNYNGNLSDIIITNSTGQKLLNVAGSMNYNYTQADANITLRYQTQTNVSDNKSAVKDIVTSLGETDDEYTIRFTSDTDATITDMGGNDTLYLYYTSNSDYWKQSNEIRLFFDVDYKGNIGNSINIIHIDKITADNAQNIANLLNGEHSMRGVLTVNGDIETIETRDHTTRWSLTPETINVTGWKQSIAQNVINWLVANNYRDVQTALASGNNGVITSLLSLYSLNYNDYLKGNTSATNLFADSSHDDKILYKGTESADIVNIPDNLEKDVAIKTLSGADKISGTVDNAQIYGGTGNDYIEVTGKNNLIVGGMDRDTIKITADENDTNYLEFDRGDGVDEIVATGKVVMKFNSTAFESRSNDSWNPDPEFTLERRNNDLTIKYSSYDSVTISNYYNNINNYTMIDMYGTQTLVKDFVSSYVASGKTITVQNNTTFNYSNDVDHVVIPTGTSGYTYNLGNGFDHIEGANITNVTINGGNDDDVITISGTGNTVNSGSGNDIINITGVGENAANTVIYNSGSGKNILIAQNSDITLQLGSSFTITNMRLYRSGDYLIVKHNSEPSGFAIKDYFNNEVTNANYKILGSDNVETVLTDYVDNYPYGNIDTLDTFIPEFSSDNEITTSHIYDAIGTEGDDTILITEKNTYIELGTGNDTVNIANSAGGNVITTAYGTKNYGSYSTSAVYVTKNTNTFVFNETNVSFSIDGNDLLISSEDLSAPIVVKDIMAIDNMPELIVQDKDNLYKVHVGKQVGNTFNGENNLNWHDDTTYKHVVLFDGTSSGSSAEVYAYNQKDNAVYLYGGIKSRVLYDNTDSLLTVSSVGDTNTSFYTDDVYQISDFSANSGVLINDDGGKDELYFSTSNVQENVVRLFFDVKKVDGNYVADMKTQGNGAYTLIFAHKDAFDADNLLAALDDNWTPNHTGIIKYNGFGDNYYNDAPNDSIEMNKSYYKADIDAWVSKITSKVRIWLETNHFDSVTLALQNGTDKQKAELLARYDLRIDNHEYNDLKEGLDTTSDATANDDAITFRKGVNNVTFGEDFGNDTITFEYSSNERIDNIEFTDFGFDDSSLSVAFGKNGNNLTKGIVFTANDGSTVTYNANSSNMYVGHQPYSNYTNPYLDTQVNITDKDRTYIADIYTTSGDLHYDWSADNDNHIAIIRNDKTGYNESTEKYDTADSTVINANNQHNITVTDGGGRLVYNYNGGNDIVNSNSNIANDMYKINSFSATSTLNINDAGDGTDNDTLIFSDNAFANTRIFFDISANQSMDDGYMADMDSLIFMHKDVADNLDGSWTNTTEGVIKVNGVDLSGSVKDENRDSIYVSLWADSIKQDVVRWLNNNDYDSVSEVFTSEKQDGDIEALIAEYNKSYDTVMNNV